MSRTPLTRRPVRAVLALTVGAASLVGLGQASAAPPVTYAVTGVSPAYVEAGVTDAFGVTLTGKGFTRKTLVRFAPCGEDGVTIAPSTVTATKLVVRPPSCGAGAQSITIREGATGAPTTPLAGKFAFLATPVVQPVGTATSAVVPASGSWAGGAEATLTLKDPLPPKAAVQVRFTDADGVVRPVTAKPDSKDQTKVSFKVPPGSPGARPKIAVSVFGILSDPVDGHFTYVSTIKTSPAVWVKGAVRPTLKIDGAGFKGIPTVTICDLAATHVEGKAPTAKTLTVTPPDWSSLPSADQATGKVCTVKVVVDGGETSAITAGSTFTYAAY